jgi:Mrp family chromosome partitioning ATPase
MDRPPGLTEVVYGQVSLGQALRPWSEGLSILAGGTPPSNPSEVLGSEAMAELIQQASRMADVVILDTPPIIPVTDAAVLSALTDGVIVVVRWASTTVEAAEQARFTLDGVGARVAGVVINAVKAVRVPAYYQEYQRPPAKASARR